MPKRRKWTNKQLVIAVKESSSYRQVIKKLNLVPAGGNYEQVKKYIQEMKLSTAHFKGKAWNKGMRGIGKPILSLEDILTKESFYQSYKLKRRLFNDGIKQPKCEECGWNKKTENGRLPLELDHINGCSTDNRLENLRILCPNCHSLKPTHRGKNKGRTKK